MSSLPGGFPWALLGAVLILIAVEVVVRRIPPTEKIAYSTGLQGHFAVASYLHAVGRADVGFIGSSLTRAGISPPGVNSVIRRRFNRTVYVASYGASGSNAEEAEAIVRYMLREKAVPAVLMYEVTPQHFRMNDDSYRLPRVAIFWNFADWMHAARTDWRDAQAVLPIVIRNEIGRVYQTFCYRDRLSDWIAIKLGLRQPMGVPIAGENPDTWQTRARLSRCPPARKRMLLDRWYDHWIADGEFPLDQSLIETFEKTLALCRENDIKLILYEMPFSKSVQGYFPQSTYPEFYGIVDSLAHEYGVPYIKVAELNLSFDDDCFADPSHMNQVGANAISRALAERAIVPLIQREGILRKKKSAPRQLTPQDAGR